MEEDELQRREEAATWLVLRLAGGIGVGVVLLGGAVLLGRRRARRREAEA